MQTTADNPSDGTAPLSDSLDELARSASESGSDAIHRAAGGAHQAVDRIAQGADNALQTLRGGSESWKVVSDESLEHANAYVREKPRMALGMAAAAGFLLSRLLR